MTTTTARATYFLKAGNDPTDAINALRASLLPGEFLAFDVETNALHPSDPRDRLTSIQVGSAHVAVLLDPDDPAHVAAARDILHDETYRLTAHNAGFDILRLVRVGVFDSVLAAWDRTTDTLILATLLVQKNGRLGNAPLDLKALTKAWCGDAAVSLDAKADLVKVQKRMGTKGVGAGNWHAYEDVTVDANGDVHGDPRDRNTWAQIPRDDPAFVTYCAADVFDSANLAATIDPIAGALWPDVIDREHRIARVVCEMTHRGVKLDVERARQQLREAHATCTRTRAELEDRGVMFERSKTSAKESPTTESVAEAIRAEGITVPMKRTADGKLQPALDKRALKKYTAAGSAASPLYREWKLSDKEISTYYVHYLRTLGDRVHAEIASNEATTGRMASKSPNLQNVPEPVKPCLVADDGMTLISADFSSVEMRVAAAVTGDPELTRMYVAPLPADATERQERERDPYWLVAWQVWGNAATVDDRKLAKTIVLGSMYGGGVATLASNADIDPDLATEILAGYRRRFPQLKSWFDTTVKPGIAAGKPFWTLPSGRFQSIDPTRAWAGFNLIIQGLARDLLLGAVFRLDEAGFSENMLLPVHDEILFQVPTTDADAACERIKQAMETVFQGVPITVEVKTLGSRWCEKSDVAKPADTASEESTTEEK